MTHPQAGRRTFVLAVSLAAAAALLCACTRTGSVEGEATPSIAASNTVAVSAQLPEDAVSAFYVAHSEGREADAFALLSRAQTSAESTAMYVEQTQWRRDLRLTKVGKSVSTSVESRPEYYRALFDVRQVTVEFFQEHDAPARERGQTIEFVNVARETPSGPWRIIEIGTGP